MLLEILSCILIFYMNVVISFAQVGIQPPPPPNNPVKSENFNKQSKDDSKPAEVKNLSVLKSAPITTSTSTKAPIVQSNSDSYIESGAVMRGVFVFVAITLLFIMYLVFKTYRKSNRKHVAIKKYGVRTRRTDTEMEPLHLDDEEEDETLFIRSTTTR